MAFVQGVCKACQAIWPRSLASPPLGADAPRRPLSTTWRGSKPSVARLGVRLFASVRQVTKSVGAHPSAQARWLALARRRGFWPLLIVILALAPRLVFWAISEHPGL